MTYLTRCVDALDRALLELTAATQARDEDQIWHRTRDVPNWLHRSEEAAKATDSGYYAQRDASHAGQTLGGLVWVRVIDHHQETTLRRLLWRPAQMRVRQDGKWVDTAVKVKQGTEWVESRPRVAVPCWPQRSMLPGTPDKNGRDTFYDQRVAGGLLLPPLEAAAAYLRQLP